MDAKKGYTKLCNPFLFMAEATRLELATSGVAGTTTPLIKYLSIPATCYNIINLPRIDALCFEYTVSQSILVFFCILVYAVGLLERTIINH